MTDTMESDSDLGAPGTATPGASQGGSDKQSSPGGVTLESVLSEMRQMDAKLRGLQSKYDQEKAQNAKETRTMKEQFAEIQGYLDRYKDPDEAARQYAIDALIRSKPQGDPTQVSEPKAPASAQGRTKGDEIDPEILQLLGVSDNDPLFVDALKQGLNPLEAAKIAAKAKNTPAPTLAGFMPSGGGQPAPTNKAALEDAYQKELTTIRRGDVAALAELKAKYRKKGLEKW